MAQGYTPKSGETVLRLNVVGGGSIFIKLHTKEAPKTTTHIIRLVEQKFYDGQRFFRVIRSPRPYLAQIGDPNSRTGDIDDPSLGTTGSGARIAYEDSGYKNEAGAVGLATVHQDKNSGDSQFYMLMADSKFLDGIRTRKGKVSFAVAIIIALRREVGG